MSKLDVTSFCYTLCLCSLLVVDFARIGKSGVVFGLVTPLDHPPETTQWVTAWVNDSILLYIK